ncbi:MAG: integration host factor subunit beta [Gallionellaceae bacterium]|jgi:integration host factor subunit beta
MTRSELIEALIAKLASKNPQLTAKDIELAAITILNEITNALVKRGRVEIRGFGSFGINKRPPRTGRNPKTGETVMVPAKEIPYFKAGKELRERVDHD